MFWYWIIQFRKHAHVSEQLLLSLFTSFMAVCATQIFCYNDILFIHHYILHIKLCFYCYAILHIN